MQIRSIIILTVFAAGAAAYSVPTRRDVLKTAAAVMSTTAATPPVLAIMSACPPNSEGCIRTTWTAPTDTNVPESMEAILDSYSQDGQSKIDLGGWTSPGGNLLKQLKRGKARLEFKSTKGDIIGKLNVEISGNKVDLKSESQCLDASKCINRKRLSYLASKANAFGFDVPKL